MNPFDQAVRYAVKQLDAAGFLRWLLPLAWSAWEWVGWLDARRLAFPGDPERTCDTVAACRRRAGDRPPLALVIEFQTRPRGDTLERLAEYLLRLRREIPADVQPRTPYDVAGAVVNLTGPEQPAVWDMTPPDLDGTGWRFAATVRSLPAESAPNTLAGIAAGQVSRGLLPWIPLMHSADDPGIVDEWKRLAGTEPDPRVRGDYGGIAKLFAELAGCKEAWSVGLEGWNMEVSQVVENWIEQGRQKGVVQGHAQGWADAERHALRRLLELRFNAVPDDLSVRIAAQADPAVLTRWFDQAFSAGSLDELRTAWTP